MPKRDQPRKINITFRLDPDIVAELDVIAAEELRTRTSLMRKLIRDGIRRWHRA